jgi:hypothetical protein
MIIIDPATMTSTTVKPFSLILRFLTSFISKSTVIFNQGHVVTDDAGNLKLGFISVSVGTEDDPDEPKDGGPELPGNKFTVPVPEIKSRFALSLPGAEHERLHT